MSAPRLKTARQVNDQQKEKDLHEDSAQGDTTATPIPCHCRRSPISFAVVLGHFNFMNLIFNAKHLKTLELKILIAGRFSDIGQFTR